MNHISKTRFFGLHFCSRQYKSGSWHNVSSSRKRYNSGTNNLSKAKLG